MTPDRFVARVATLRTRAAPRVWPWAEANREAIARNWERRRARTPKLFNGRVLLIADHALEDDCFRADYFPCDYADFLGWMDAGFPDRAVLNGFAMGALQGAEGAFVMGVMGDHTANAGRVYFAAGTPDLSDLRPDGTVDLGASVLRELREEAGLEPPAAAIADDWIIARDGQKLSFLRPIRMPEPAEAVAARIRAHIAAEAEPELAGVRIVRGPDDIDEAAMPDFLKGFLRWHYSDAGRPVQR